MVYSERGARSEHMEGRKLFPGGFLSAEFIFCLLHKSRPLFVVPAYIKRFYTGESGDPFTKGAF